MTFQRRLWGRVAIRKRALKNARKVLGQAPGDRWTGCEPLLELVNSDQAKRDTICLPLRMLECLEQRIKESGKPRAIIARPATSDTHRVPRNLPASTKWGGLEGLPVAVRMCSR